MDERTQLSRYFILVTFSLVLLAAAGCNKDKQAPTRPPAVPPTTTAADASVMAAQPVYKCAGDRDCVVDCTIGDSCCGQECECSNVYHRDQLVAVKAANGKKCATRDVECSRAKCAPPTHRVVARCRDRTCVAVNVPFDTGMDENGFFSDRTTPDALACIAPSDCLANTRPDTTGCCMAPRAIVPYNKAYRKWLSGWRQQHCADAWCPPPPPPAKPRDCEIAVGCSSGRCVNTCARP